MTSSDLARLRSPLGLDLGGRDPQEVAVSVLAEVVAVRRGRTGGPLMEANGSIREPAAERALSLVPASSG